MKDLEIHFNRMFKKDRIYTPIQTNLGFIHNFTPIISNDNPDFITMAQWGLIPFWAKDKAVQKNTLNAKIETLSQKPSFRTYVNNRCLIIADGFYEWQWLDEKGKNKKKYLITIPNKELFAFAGLFSDYTDKSTGEVIRTYTMITSEANELMAQIHNTKKRMPVILPPDYENPWLNNEPIEDFCKIEIELNAVKI